MRSGATAPFPVSRSIAGVLHHSIHVRHPALSLHPQPSCSNSHGLEGFRWCQRQPTFKGPMPQLRSGEARRVRVDRAPLPLVRRPVGAGLPVLR